jgi:ABC-2 type transport system ATP-binding protein
MHSSAWLRYAAVYTLTTSMNGTRSNSIPDRHAEIVSLLESGDLARASGRLQDFARDFGAAAELLAGATALRRQYLGVRNDGALNTALTSQATALADRLRDDALLRPPPFPLTDVVCSSSHLEKYYRKGAGFRLWPVDITLRFGEITAVVGENGNGKSTLIRILVGALAASAGDVIYPYFGLTEQPQVMDYYALKQRIAYIPQDLPRFHGRVRESLLFTGAAHGLPPQDIPAEVEFIISRLGLDSYADLMWNELSGGYRMRFALAQALLTRPSLLALDEPLANLDINTQLFFLQDLRSIADSLARPLSILVSSQHLHEIESIADRLLFLRNGQSIYNGTRAEYGTNRSENIFECACDAGKDRLRELLKPLGATRIESVGNHLIVALPVSVLPAHFLSTLLTAGVGIEYFRDISHSTRKLFETSLN